MEKEDKNNVKIIDFLSQKEMKRRDFIKLVGGGIVILFSVGDPLLLEAQMGDEYPSDFNAYLRINENGRITCYSGKAELGQGVITSLAQMAAEELNVTVESIDMVLGDTTLCPYDRSTTGSRTTRFFGPALRAAAAEAKGVLIELASERLKASKENLVAEYGVIFEKGRKENRVMYGELAQGKKITRRLDKQAVLKSVSEFSTIGKPYLRSDAVEKVSGKARYAGDIRLPGMLYAKILRPPAHNATLKKVDTSTAKKIEKITIIEEGDLVAALHENPETAEKALELIKAEFDVPAAEFDDKTIFDHLLKVAGEPNVTEDDGNIEKGIELSSKTFEAQYYNSYVAHAPIETHSALAHVENSKATVWISTQSPFGLRDQIANALGIKSDNVRTITPFVGGGFGGKTAGRQAIEAAKLSKLVGKPVQVVWNRSEEFFNDTFRPAAVVKIKSGINDAGKITFWDYDVYYAGTRGANQFYNIPNNKIKSYGSRKGITAHPFGTGAWRAPSNNTNTFARESHIDIMASQAGIDPVEFRLNNLTDERMRKVLETAAKEFGWTKAGAPSRRGIGVSLGTDSGTYVGTIAEVEVNKSTGKVRVKRIVCAQDMGIVVNPEGAKIQMEGCVTMGLGYALTEEIQFRGGEILNRNFDGYELPRFSWLPEIKTVLVENKELTPQGGGEPAVINMGAVIANAIFDAIGARVFQLPMTPERILKALKRG
jgi:isoquinoline 1-oxidoreductase